MWCPLIDLRVRATHGSIACFGSQEKQIYFLVVRCLSQFSHGDNFFSLIVYAHCKALFN